MKPITRRDFLELSGASALAAVPLVNNLGQLFKWTAPPDGGERYLYFRPQNMLLLEIELINLQVVAGKLKFNDKPPSIRFMLQPLHKAEVNFRDDQTPTEGAASFLASPSWLVFDVKRPNRNDEIAFNVEEILSWGTDRLSLRGVNQASHFYSRPDAQSQLIFEEGRTMSETTTLEMPVGIFLSPYQGPGERLTFRTNNNILKAPKGWDFEQTILKVEEKWRALGYKGTILARARYWENPKPEGNAIEPEDTLIQKQSHLLWNNSLILKGKNITVPKFKLIDTDSFKIDLSHQVLPEQSDKDLLSRQFRADKQNKEFVLSTSEQFMLTGSGAYAKLGYESSDPTAILQKWNHEMILGRDQYVEVHRLGFIYPFGHRAAEVQISERVNRNGISYLRRWRVIKRIDDVMVYREPLDQASTEAGIAESVLLPRKDYAENNAHSLRRCFPFSSIEILTSTSAAIRFIEVDLTLILKRKNDEVIKIKQKIEELAATYLGSNQTELLEFFTALKPKLAERRNDFPFDVPSWIVGLIRRESAWSGDDLNKLLKSPADEPFKTYINNLRYLGEFRQFVRQVGETGQLPDDKSILADSLLKKVSSLMIALRDEVTSRIVALYNSIPDQKPEDFRAAFETIARKLAAEDIVGTPESIKDIAANTTKLAGLLTADEANARAIFTAHTENFISECSMLIFEHPDKAGKHSTEFKTAVSNFRKKNSAVVSFTDMTLDEVHQLILGYWPRVQDNDEVVFEFVGTDWEGNRVKFNAPFVFIHAEANRQVEELKKNLAAQLAALQAEVAQVPADNAEQPAPAADVVTLATLESFINDVPSEIETYLRKFETDLTQNLQGKLNTVQQLAKDHVSKLKKADLYYEIQPALDKLHSLDYQISKQYHRASNEALRQINMANQKLAFYKSEAKKAADEVKQSVTALNTYYVEFAAAGIAKMQLLRDQVKDSATDTAKRLRSDVITVFPQVQVASVQLPIMKDFGGDARGVLVSYGEAFKKAGLEVIDNTATEALKSIKKEHMAQRENLEQILFDVKSYRKEAENTFNQWKSDVDATSKEVKERINELKNIDTLAKDELDTFLRKQQADLKNLARKAQQDATNFVDGEVRGFFKNAGKTMGSLVDPSPVCRAISTAENTYYALKGTVDQFKGTIQNTVNKAKDDLTNEAQRYTNEAKQMAAGLFADLKIFGISLKDLIDTDQLEPTELPGLKIERIDGKPAGAPFAIPVAIRTSYHWNPEKPIFKSGTTFRWGESKHVKTAPRLDIDVVSFIPFDHSQESEIKSTITLQRFGIAITADASDLLVIYFKKIEFVTRSWSKNGNTYTSSKVNVQIANVEFDYYLKLIEQLQKLLGLGGFIIDITPSGLQLSMGLRIPTVSTGPFTITNASLYAGMILPFTSGDLPRVRFSFSERRNPFTLAAGIFGGRGFIALEADAVGMQLFEASLEFGGYLGLNLGVASGQAYLMAGIYFRKSRGGSVYVEAYIVCGGSLSIIGIITVSIVFYLGMGYQNGMLVGMCSVTVSISVLFFSASYSLTLEKRLSGSSTSVNLLHPDAHDKLWASNKDGQYALADETGPGTYWFKNDPLDNECVLITDPTILFSHVVDKQKKDAKRYVSYFD